jgi:hypothetical protein
MRLRLLVASATALLALLACSAEPDSPEVAVRATLAAIETAAGERDVAGVRERISDAYADSRGNDKANVVQVAAFHLLRNQAVYTLSRILRIDTSEPGRAAVEVLVALAGSPIDDSEALLTVNADLYRFEVALREEEPGSWRVTASSWQPATLADFR